MPFFRKYGTLLVTGSTSVRVPLIKRSAVDFALGADWTPAAGDVKVFVDGAAVANITNLPTAIASGNGAFWEFILTAAELTCKQLLVVVSDAATKAVEDQAFVVETYGNASATYITDFSAQLATPTNITAATGVVLSGVTHTGAVIPTVTTTTTATNVTTVNGLAANVISAASIAASAMNGKGDWNIGKTGYALSSAGVQAIWDALTSALTTAGSIGKFLVDNLSPLVSGTADAGGTTTTMVDAARTEAATDHWKGQAIVFTSGTNLGLGALITAFDAATDTMTFTPAVPAAIGAGVTYQILPAAQAILAGLVHTGATVPTVTTLTGHTANTGDPFARIGALGAGLTGIPWNAAWDAEVQSEVDDALNTAISELGVAAPTATPTVRTALMLMYMALRNKLDVQTSGVDAIEVHNDAGTQICSKAITDDGLDYSEAKMA